MPIQDLIRWLLPKEDHFYDYLESQAKAANEGAVALSKFTEGGETAANVADVVQKIEHRGDGMVHEMEEALAKTFVTPIDREDLQKLSSELDDVLDRMNGAIRACVMMGVTSPTQPMRDLVKILIRCTEQLAIAVPKLRKHEYSDIVLTARELRKIEKEADMVFRQAVSALFRDQTETDAGKGPYRETDPAFDPRILIREKTVLEDLENAVDQCDALADTLTNLAVKHG
jgi:uncharacterized protein Yka (UPF0111/DUF47 family)